MNRAQLVERKEAIRADIAQTRQELARTQQGNPNVGRVAELEARLQSLMAEEHRLRLLIDRSPRAE